MKLPRDVSGSALIKALRALGHEPSRQRGSHIRVTTQRDGEHHETIPHHDPIKLGLLGSILTNIATHHRLSLEQLDEALDL
jgi:predicted RNA binding protein YcfA (HicA-like mRNA interferase family)